jgi:protocatechuate 3,4-dioxygenase, alpha subunit
VTLPLTPSQTIGPFFAVGLIWPDGPDVVAEGAPGAVRIGGRVLDGAGEPVADALVETWQADPQGGFTHPDDPRGPGTRGSEGSGGRQPTPRGAGRSAPSSPGRCRHPTAAPRPRIWMCRCSPGGCWVGW